MDFYYDGKHGSDFGIEVTNVSEPSFGIERESIIGEKTKYRPKSHLLGVKYVDNLHFVLTVMKDFCLYPEQEDAYFTSQEVGRISAWLTSPQTYRPFHFEENDYFLGDFVEYFAIIRNITTSTAEDGYITYLEIEVECDSPYGWSREYVKTATATSDSPATIVIANNSDEWEDYVYPYIEIQSPGGSITITNLSEDNRSFTFIAPSGTTIIDTINSKIVDKDGKMLKLKDLGIDDVDKILLPRLIHGENKIQVTGNATITIKYRTPRKVGAF